MGEAVIGGTRRSVEMPMGVNDAQLRGADDFGSEGIGG
jgi:hypothetical protein